MTDIQKRLSKPTRCSLLLGAAMLISPGLAMAQSAASDAGTPITDATPTPEAGGQTTGVEEIVVTAQKREQSLQKVPISISALSPTMILANRIQDVRDLSGVVPNLTVRPSAGGNASPNYSMRGIFTNGSAVGVDKGIALYIDGVYIQASNGSIFELADVERIEVLKGPQGTLFGRNATAGAISLITRNPTGEFSARQELTYGNYDQLRSKTHVELPKIGPFSASLTYLHSEREGDTRNLGAGTVWDYGRSTGGRFGLRTSPERLGNQNVEAFFGALKADLLPDLDLVYKFDYSQNHYTPEAEGVSFLDPTSPLTGLYLSVPAALRTPISLDRPKAVNNAFTTPSYTRTYGHNLTAGYRFNDQIVLKNILSLRKTYQQSTFQLDGLGGISLFPGSRFVITTNNAESIERQWSNETQLNVTTDWFNLTAGFIHFEDKFATAGFEGTFNTYIGSAGSGTFIQQANGSFLIPSNPGYLHSRVKAVSDAWFIQPEFHLTEQLDLVLGARITKDRKTGLEFAPVPSAVPAAARTSAIAYRETKPTFLAGLNFQATPDILTYVKFATGYVSGGQLATIPFQPETAKSYEGGIKADLFNRRVRSNLAVFYVDYKNVQYTTSGQIVGVPSAALYSQAVVSSGDGRAYGAEWENTVVPLDGLTLTGNLGYTNFKFDDQSIFPGFAFVSGAPGYQEFSRPKWTGQLAAQYETGELFLGGHLLARVDGNYRSKALLSSDLTVGVGPTSMESAALRAGATAPSYWIVNGRLALVDIGVGGLKAQVALWGRNIFDEKPIVQYVGFGPFGPVQYERARTYGVDVSFAF